MLPSLLLLPLPASALPLSAPSCQQSVPLVPCVRRRWPAVPTLHTRMTSWACVRGAALRLGLALRPGCSLCCLFGLPRHLLLQLSDVLLVLLHSMHTVMPGSTHGDLTQACRRRSFSSAVCGGRPFRSFSSCRPISLAAGARSAIRAHPAHTHLRALRDRRTSRHASMAMGCAVKGRVPAACGRAHTHGGSQSLP